MAIKRKIKELQKRREEVLQGGGEQAILKQQAMGKLTARERIVALLDKGSFSEYDLFVEHEARDFDMDKKVLHGDGVRYRDHSWEAGGHFCPGLYCCRWIAWVDAQQKNYQDHGSCPENEDAADWNQ